MWVETEETEVTVTSIPEVPLIMRTTRELPSKVTLDVVSRTVLHLYPALYGHTFSCYALCALLGTFLCHRSALIPVQFYGHLVEVMEAAGWAECRNGDIHFLNPSSKLPNKPPRTVVSITQHTEAILAEINKCGSVPYITEPSRRLAAFAVMRGLAIIQKHPLDEGTWIQGPFLCL